MQETVTQVLGELTNYPPNLETNSSPIRSEVFIQAESQFFIYLPVIIPFRNFAWGCLEHHKSHTARAYKNNCLYLCDDVCLI